VKIWLTDQWNDWRRGGVVVLDVTEEQFRAWLRPDRGNLLLIPRDVLAPWRDRDLFTHTTIAADKWHRSEEEALAAIRREVERREKQAKRDLEKATALRKRIAAEGMPIARTLAEQKAERRAKLGPPKPRKPSGCPIPKVDGLPCTVGAPKRTYSGAAAAAFPGACNTHANQLQHGTNARADEARRIYAAWVKEQPAP
jgi:hypothetical protein